MAIRFKETLRWLRKEAGLSQKELAEKIHANPNNVCQWETGRCEPSFDTLERIADLFCILPGDLLNGFGGGE